MTSGSKGRIESPLREKSVTVVVTGSTTSVSGPRDALKEGVGKV